MTRPGGAVLIAPRYVLGETEVHHAAVEGFKERALEFKMQLDARLWGWGSVRTTRRSVAELAAESGAATLAASGLALPSIDAVLLCSTRFPGGAQTHGAFVEGVVAGLGLRNPAVYGLTLNRCTNLLTAIQLADALVAAGRHRRILVITADRIAADEPRMEKFALFSDGAASCVIAEACDGDDAYEILATATAQDSAALDWSHEISSDLSRQVNQALLQPAGLQLAEVDGLLHANLFKPLVVMKERQAGFTARQLYTDNIERFGHCFAADPLINLADRTAAGRVADGGHYLLASSVPGSRAGVLLRRLPTRRAAATASPA